MPGQNFLSSRRLRRVAAALVATALLSSCGGGGGGGSTSVSAAPATGAFQTIDASLAKLSAEQLTKELLDSERDRCGFGRLRTAAGLNQAALNHAEYNAWQAAGALNISLHLEILGQPLFTGVTLFERARYVGYDFAEIWESVNSLYWRNVPTSSGLPPLQNYAQDQVGSLLTMVYHLKGMLVNTTEFGTAVIERTHNGNLTRQFVIELATPTGDRAPTQTGLKVYPCVNSQMARAIFNPRSETPNPKPGYSGVLGTPIYIRAPAGQRISLTSAALIDVATGTRIPVETMTRANDPAGELAIEDAFILPLEPLIAGRLYRANFSVNVGGQAQTGQTEFRPV